MSRGEPLTERHSGLLIGLGEAVMLLLLPVLAVWLFNISIIDQEGYVDPEFYTGYGQSFERMWTVFGLTYYAARFPIMFLNTTTQWLLPGVGGYAIAHYVAFLAAAVPLYLLARRHYGWTVAAASYAFLLMNPLFPRILCWDLTTSLSIPAGLSGIGLWLLARRPWGACAFAGGFMFATSLNSHVFTGTAIAVFLAVDLAFSMFRPRGWLAFTIRSCTAAAGAVTCGLLGLLFYRVTIGGVSPLSLWRVTTNAITAGQTYAETNYVPFSAYYATNYEIYAPLIAVVVALVLNRRRLLSNTLDAQLTWFASAYLAAYVAAVFALRMNVVQYFWYFGHLTIAVYLIVPVILARVAEAAGRQGVIWFAGALALVSFTVSGAFSSIDRLSMTMAGSGSTVAAVLGLTALAGLLVCLSRRAAVTAGAVLCALLLQVSYLSRSHLSVYNTVENAAEAPLIDVIRQYHSVLGRYDTPRQRVRTWYRTANGRLLSVASSNLLFTLQSPWAGPGMPQIEDAEREILHNPTTRYVLLIGEDQARIDEGLRALADAQIRFAQRERHDWRFDPVHLSATLVELTK